MPRRLERVNALIRDEIAKLLERDVRDPRLPLVVSVTRVETSVDLGHARVFVSVMGTPEEVAQAMKGLQSAAPFMRRALRGRLSLRHIPELQFVQDSSIETGSHLLHIMQELEEHDSGR